MRCSAKQEGRCATGAAQARPGLLKAADGGRSVPRRNRRAGTDEQAMLLRALEEGVYLAPR
ncbi:MAG: hypothetical protein R3E96_02165 [Planctomycetota bacterium]